MKGGNIPAYASPHKEFSDNRFSTDRKAPLNNHFACSHTLFSSLTSIHEKDNSGQLSVQVDDSNYYIYIYSPLHSHLTEIPNNDTNKIDFSKHTQDCIIIGLCARSKRLFNDSISLKNFNDFLHKFLSDRNKMPEHSDYNQMIKKTLIEKYENKRREIYSDHGIIQTLMEYINRFKAIESADNRTLIGFENWLGLINSEAQNMLYEYIETFDIKENMNTFNDLDETLGKLTYGGSGSFFTANMSSEPYQLPAHKKRSCIIL